VIELARGGVERGPLLSDERGSGSTHGSPSKTDVEKLKMYVDVCLVELLETR
jgi:hypothetical protein